MCRFILLLCLAVLLPACSWFSSDTNDKKIEDTPMDVSISVGKVVNPSASSHANPVAIYLYQLKTKEPFANQNALDLYQKDAQLLADSLIIKQILKPLLPNEKRKIHLGLRPETRFVGVFVVFSNYSASKSTAIVSLAQKKDDDQIGITVSMLSVNIKLIHTQSLWKEVKGVFSWL